MRQKGNLRLLLNANLWAEMQVSKMEGGKVRQCVNGGGEVGMGGVGIALCRWHWNWSKGMGRGGMWVHMHHLLWPATLPLTWPRSCDTCPACRA